MKDFSHLKDYPSVGTPERARLLAYDAGYRMTDTSATLESITKDAEAYGEKVDPSNALGAGIALHVGIVDGLRDSAKPELARQYEVVLRDLVASAPPDPVRKKSPKGDEPGPAETSPIVGVVVGVLVGGAVLALYLKKVAAR